MMTNILPVETVRKMGKSELYSFAARGILTVEMNTPIPHTKEQTPEYQKHAHLQGQTISISEGARKYEIAHQTISRWVKRKLIPVLGQDKNRVLISEWDLAYCVEVQRNRPGQGKWLFDKNGLPYVPETTG